MKQPAPIWTRITWRYPQWWLFAISLLAWLAMIAHADSNGAILDSIHQHHHGGTFMAMSWTSETYCWMLMVVAMMLPLIADSARSVATRSLWYRRQRAIVAFVLGYLSVWLAAGVVVSLILVGLRSQAWFDSGGALTVSFLAAVGWQFAPLKKRALIACHRTRPVAPKGLQANLGCIRYGWMIGGSCLLNCWAWMVFCVMTGHYLGVMLFAMFIGVAERYSMRKLRGIAMSPSSLLTSFR